MIGVKREISTLPFAHYRWYTYAPEVHPKCAPQLANPNKLIFNVYRDSIDPLNAIKVTESLGHLSIKLA